MANMPAISRTRAAARPASPASGSDRRASSSVSGPLACVVTSVASRGCERVLDGPGRLVLTERRELAGAPADQVRRAGEPAREHPARPDPDQRALARLDHLGSAPDLEQPGQEGR